MAPEHSDTSLDEFPTELVDSVKARAERDAVSVAQFMGCLGLNATPEKPVPLPAGFLLSLAAALRLLAWEVRGFNFHREAGLPSASEAIRDAFERLLEKDAKPSPICNTVGRLALERFAWAGEPELGADVAIDDVDEELFLDALADFLWANRPR